MLRGEDFRGGHQRDLRAVLDGHQRGLHGHDGFAGTDIALQQAAHGLRAAHVGDDLPEHAFLRGGGVKGQHLLDGLEVNRPQSRHARGKAETREHRRRKGFGDW